MVQITAILEESSFTVSGRPDMLASFSSHLPTSINVHKTSLSTLYHSSTHLEDVRAAVFRDISHRDIRFPTFEHLKVPVWSTYTGNLLDPSAAVSLVAAVVDMILVQPIHWDKVTQSVIAATTHKEVRLLNFGPGAGLAKSTKRAFPLGKMDVLDVTNPRELPMLRKSLSPQQEPIAIVGMAINMPGAPNVDKLWEVLEQGINTVTEV